METIEIYGQISVKSGDKAEEVLEPLVNAGFDIAYETCTKTYSIYQILKKKK